MRLLQLLKAKIHHARVTYANPDYVGSIEIDQDLMDRVGIQNGEMVQIWAVDHPARLNTYAFAGPKGVIGMNGGAARFFNPGDRVIISAYTWTDEDVTPKIILVDDNNAFVREIRPFHVQG